MILWAISLHRNIDSFAVFLYIILIAANSSYFILDESIDSSKRDNNIHYSYCSVMEYLNTLKRFFFYRR